jgi:hypothetical protein
MKSARARVQIITAHIEHSVNIWVGWLPFELPWLAFQDVKARIPNSKNDLREPALSEFDFG